jgi:hypothetical protein
MARTLGLQMQEVGFWDLEVRDFLLEALVNLAVFYLFTMDFQQSLAQHQLIS